MDITADAMPSFSHAQTVIRYASGRLAEAELLQRYLAAAGMLTGTPSAATTPWP